MNGAFGIYVHWPYCARVCPYCDFNIYRDRGQDPEPLLAAISRDLEAHAQRLGRRPAQSVFFGGGTPSLLTGAQITGILAAADRAFGLASDCEVTLEVNPEDWPKLAGHAAAGVNRFSIGAQALDDEALKALRRNHDAAAAVRAVEAAARTGRRVSVDFIYAREGQTPDAWARELEQALALPAEHFSFYQLTIEHGTAFERAVRRGHIIPPDLETAGALFLMTREIAAAAGAPAYEISNHARSEAAKSRHNLLYWRGQDWIGVGPGAHGRFWLEGERWASRAHAGVADYVAATRAEGLGWADAETLTSAEAADELMLMGLRLNEGVDIGAVERLRGAPLGAEQIAGLEAAGLVQIAGSRLRLQEGGFVLADRITLELDRPR